MSQPALETFRAEVRDWLEANCPQSMRTPMPQDEMPSGGKHIGRFPSSEHVRIVLHTVKRD